MPAPLEVEFTNKGIDDLLRKMDRVEKSFQKMAGGGAGSGAGGFGAKVNQAAQSINRAAQALNSAAKSLNMVSNDLLKAARIFNSAAGRMPKNPSSNAQQNQINNLMNWAPGALGRLQRAQEALRQAKLTNDPQKIANAQLHVDAAYKAWQNAMPSFGKALKDMFMTSRVTIGPNGMPQLMPLVNRIMRLFSSLGPEAQAWAGLGGALIVATTALFDISKAAAEAAKSFSALQNHLASSGATTAGLASMGASMGMSPQAVGALADSLQSAITSSPIGRAFGMQLGAFNISGPFGNQDYGQQLEEAVEALSAIPDKMQRAIVARYTGLEGALPFSNQSQGQRSRSRLDAKAGAMIFSDSFQTKSADFLAALGRLSIAGGNLMASIANGPMQTFTGWMNMFADAMDSMAMIFKKIEPYVRMAAQWIPGLNVAFSGADAVGGAQADLEDATRENTAAHHETARQLQMLNGRFGRGDRLDGGGVLPAGASGMFLQKALAAGGFQLSSF